MRTKMSGEWFSDFEKILAFEVEIGKRPAWPQRSEGYLERSEGYLEPKWLRCLFSSTCSAIDDPRMKIL